MFRIALSLLFLATLVTRDFAQTPCECWIEPDGGYSLALQPNDDHSTTGILLPFQVNLYGDLYGSLWINNNGNVTFTGPVGIYSPGGFPAEYDTVMIAPFWADIDTRADSASHGSVRFKVTPSAIYINWIDVGYYDHHGDLRNSFQLIISDGIDPVIPNGNNVSFCYRSMQWTTGDASGGQSGFGGFPATVGANRGNGTDYFQVGRFDHSGMDWDGPYDLGDGVDWLNNRHFAFSTADSTIPPVFTDLDCDTVEIEVGMPLERRAIAIPGNVGTMVTGSSVCPSIVNYASTTSSIGQATEIISTLTPNMDEVGLHAITYHAHDNAVIPHTSTWTTYVRVLASTVGVRDAPPGQDPVLNPNPADDAVDLRFPGHAPSRIEVTALDGSVVRSLAPDMGSDHIHLDINGLRAGVYMIRTFGPEGIGTARLVHTGPR
ncbi:MAG: hypothetical protein JST66_08295 [Bacteroidetes bacterium]|nr:hypothetical protein [Bacteroidota bacterium]